MTKFASKYNKKHTSYSYTFPEVPVYVKLGFLYKENGRITMIWSSFIHGDYSVLVAQADSIRGKWEHNAPKFDFDGGHSMIFETLEGQKKISLHRPNTLTKERAVFYDIEIK